MANFFENVMMMSGLTFWFIVLLGFIVDFVVPFIVALTEGIIKVIYKMATMIWNDILEYHEYKRLRNYYYDFDEVIAEEARKIK